MIGVAAAVVAHGRANFSGSAFRSPISASIGFDSSSALPMRLIALLMLVMYALMVFGVMDLHRARVDVRLECIICVG